ncbi:MAG: zinc ribbon domain-containing protein [Armatimonadetes bacterium]|nr:zinc ribbon domain-containing protein [Armatimonadota bacterium]
MPERTFRDVEIDLDDLADAVVDWFERDAFEVQDFQEGPSIFIQARKQSLLNTLSGTGKSLNVRLSPLSRGFKIEVGAGDWLDKGAGAAVAFGVRMLNPLLFFPAIAATGYGIYQQLKLPEELLDFVEVYVDEHGVGTVTNERQTRTRRRDVSIDEELEELKSGRPATAAPAEREAGKRYCPKCGAQASGDANFCHGCGADLRGVGEAEDGDSSA